jgi:hypothetical protein
LPLNLSRAQFAIGTAYSERVSLPAVLIFRLAQINANRENKSDLVYLLRSLVDRARG